MVPSVLKVRPAIVEVIVAEPIESLQVGWVMSNVGVSGKLLTVTDAELLLSEVQVPLVTTAR